MLFDKKPNPTHPHTRARGRFILRWLLSSKLCYVLIIKITFHLFVMNKKSCLLSNSVEAEAKASGLTSVSRS